MAKLFGEFLLDEGVVQPDQLLSALIIQIREIPSVAEVVSDHKLMSAADILKVLAYQQRTGSEFRTAAKDLGFWSEDLSIRINNLINSNRRPIGEILTGQGVLSLATLTSALDRYVELAQRPKATISASEQGRSLSEDSPQRCTDSTPVARPPVRQPLDGTTTSRGSAPASFLEPVLIREFVEIQRKVFHPALNELSALVSIRTASTEARREILARCLAEFVGINAALSFLGARHLNDTGRQVVHQLNKALQHPERMEFTSVAAMIEAADSALKRLADVIMDYGSELPLAGDQEFCNAAARLSAAIGSLCAEDPVAEEAG